MIDVSAEVEAISIAPRDDETQSGECRKLTLDCRWTERRMACKVPQVRLLPIIAKQEAENFRTSVGKEIG